MLVTFEQCKEHAICVYYVLFRFTDDLCVRCFSPGSEHCVIALRCRQKGACQCLVCVYVSRNKNMMRIHISIHTGEKLYRCPKYSYAAAQKGNLTRHMGLAHKGL